MGETRDHRKTKTLHEYSWEPIGPFLRVQGDTVVFWALVSELGKMKLACFRFVWSGLVGLRDSQILVGCAQTAVIQPIRASLLFFSVF